MATKVFSSIQNLGAGLTLDIRPAIGVDWAITDLASSAMVGVPPASVPNLTAGMFDGVVAAPALFRISSVAAPHIRGWANPCEWHVSNANFVRITNPEAGGLTIAISVVLGANYGPNAASRVISDSQALGAGLILQVRPPVGQDWLITDIGSNIWLGAQPAGLPDVTVDLTDGVNAVTVAQAPCARGWFKPFELYLNRNTWMQLTNTGANAIVGWSGVISAEYGSNGASHVISDTALLGAGGVGLIQPPIGEEWIITDVGCSVWTGVPGIADLPSVLVQYTDGAINAIAQQGIDSKGWLGKMKYALSRTVYLSLTDAGAGSNVGWSGVRQPD